MVSCQWRLYSTKPISKGIFSVAIFLVRAAAAVPVLFFPFYFADGVAVILQGASDVAFMLVRDDTLKRVWFYISDVSYKWGPVGVLIVLLSSEARLEVSEGFVVLPFTVNERV